MTSLFYDTYRQSLLNKTKSKHHYLEYSIRQNIFWKWVVFLSLCFLFCLVLPFVCCLAHQVGLPSGHLVMEFLHMRWTGMMLIRLVYPVTIGMYIFVDTKILKSNQHNNMYIFTPHNFLKNSSKVLQNLPNFWHKKTQIVFFISSYFRFVTYIEC